MATVTFGNIGTRPYGVLTVTETATDLVNNTSTVSIVLTLKRPYEISSSATKTATCTVNGTAYSWSGSIGGSGDLVLISKTQTVYHNADGSKTISLSASIVLDITWSGEWVGTIRGNGTMQLSTLPVNKPSIGSVTYKDVNSTTVAITGNNQQIVQNQSYVSFTVTGIQAYYATISRVTATVNGSVYDLTVSGSTATNSGIQINSGSNVDAVITVTDSKGLSTSKTITITMVAWSIPTAVITAERQNNYYTATTLTVNAGYTQVGSNTVSITYSCTDDNQRLATVSGTLQDGVASTVDLDNTTSWTVWVHLTDSFGGKSSYKASVSRGMPIIFFDYVKSSVGINCFPVGEKTLEINGKEITAPTRVNVQVSANTTNSLAYTGASIKIPAGCMFVLSGCIAYNSAKPVQVTLSTSNTNGTYAVACNEATQNYAPLVCTGTDYASGDTTIYLWAKWASASSTKTPVWIKGYYIPV